MLWKMDTREEPWRAKAIKDIALKLGHEVKDEELPTGDLCIGPELGFEFKEPGDFIESIKNGRLFQQASEMPQAYKRSIFVINGEPNDLLRTRSEMHPNAIMGAISSLVHHYGCEVQFTGQADKVRFQWYMGHQLAKATDGKASVADYSPVRRMAKDDDYAVAILSTFPGIGWKKAKQLLGHFKSLERVLYYLTEEPDVIPKEMHGFGKKTVDKMRGVLLALHQPYVEQVLPSKEAAHGNGTPHHEIQAEVPE